MKDVKSALAGTISVEKDPSSPWKWSVERETPEDGVEIFRFKLTVKREFAPEKFALRWTIPAKDIHCRWTPDAFFGGFLPPEWGSSVETAIAQNMPLMLFGATGDENRFLFAVSEAKKHLRICGGLREEDNLVHCKAEFFLHGDAPMKEYDFSLRFDARKIFYADAVSDAVKWYETFPEYRPAETPEAAFEALYSTWYSYHQKVSASVLEKEYALAAKLGIKSAILDDGWQTDDDRRGYAYCGDWEVAEKKFPDMRKHVEKVHALGMKYLVWFSVPFIGKNSKNYARFKGKYLYDHTAGKLHAAVVDPRFPDVRDFLVETFSRAVLEWDLDGLKLDFINCFCFENGDPAVAENYAGRDIFSLPDAVDLLMTEIMENLRRIKPEILIEFRQTYIGPAIRRSGNIFRAGDCPADFLSNRRRTLDLRLTSGKSAVHSDMLEWHYGDSVENAARQLLNVLFCVPQISVRLAELKDDHLKMLRHYLDFWRAHRDLLLQGNLRPFGMDAQYPVVTVQKNGEFLAAVYAPDQCVRIPSRQKSVYIVNASSSTGIIVSPPKGKYRVEIFDVCGKKQKTQTLYGGLREIGVPLSGMAVWHRLSGKGEQK
ncbi:MAG: alpha-galactosidase [Victivallaceae bacterium]|nr:alpha-galactosidase [Victivallaceae bacterium]